ncbi:hypothetical protein PVAP13_5KG219000 [Panicum virgatum]|uniref:Uncharacterized protein n=1 Tax=Panicum virgatum TaxID=38727 RepID=A0A8T0SMD8_PANVG|nr:hypothetical protein PVAP13_5KG219000 [Panicum virgatum]
MVQGVVHRALRDIHHQRIALQHSSDHHERRSLQTASGLVLPARGVEMAPPPPATSMSPMAAVAPWRHGVGHLSSPTEMPTPRSDHRPSPTTSLSKVGETN